ncbi:MAG: SurA N-terminal domain-containing protein [Holosporales bacterium]|nr:SurA N-terminal domain-containing protein [Holosporales bacterium]
MSLKNLRNAADGIFIKIIFGAVILSFSLFGVVDVVRNYFESKSVFKVNGIGLAAPQFLKLYSQEKQRIRNIISRPLSEMEMENLNIKENLLEKLVNSALIDAGLLKFKIVVPQKSISRVVYSLPKFQTNGKFDRRLYEMGLRQGEINETELLKQIKNIIAQTQLIHPIMAGYKLPNFIKECIIKEFDSESTILISRLNLSSVKYDENVFDNELKQHYDNDSQKYQRPETRDVSLLVIDYRNLLSSMKIDEHEIKQHYEANKDAYKPEEMRTFEKFVFEKKDFADKAWEMLNRDTPLSVVTKKLSPIVSTIEKTHSFDFPKEIGDELFKLLPQKTSRVYQSEGKYYLYRLTKIEKSKQKTEQEIREEIRKELQEDKLNSPEFYLKIKDIKNKIDDGFGSGSSVEEIAKETGARVITLSKLQQSSSESSKLNDIVPDADTRAEVLDAIFATEEQQASQTIDSREADTVSYVVFVDAIQKTQVPPFEEIKEQVKRDYIAKGKNKKIIERINEVINKGKEAANELKKMGDFKKFACSQKDLILNKDNSNVEKILKEIPNSNVVFDVISKLKEGEATYYKVKDGEYIIVAIDNVKKSQGSSPEFVSTISRHIDDGTEREVLLLLLKEFRNNFKVDIDYKFIDEIVKNENHEID